MIWTANDIITATNGKCENTDWQTEFFCIDSRKVKTGDVFIALKTDNADGHDYVQMAKDNGAVAVIVEKNIDIDIPQVVVKDTLTALTDIGIFARNKLTGTVIGITGSVGKTSVKDMLKNSLDKYGKTSATLGNLNNHLGVPLTLAHTPIDSEFIIIEMGMSALLEIDGLTKIANPHIALVVSVENNHLEFFDHAGQIALAKAEIFNGLDENGIAIYNNSTNFTDVLKYQAEQNTENIITYGGEDIKDIKIDNQSQSVSVKVNHKDIDLTINGLGNHRILNTLAVLNTISALKLDLSKALTAIKNTSPSAGRGKIETIGKIDLFDEVYNASPASMKSALQVLGLSQTSGRRIAVLGDMLELGEDSIKLHTDLLKSITDNNVDLVFACGENMKHLFDILPDNIKGAYENNSSMLSTKVIESLKDNDTVLVKGSNSLNMKLIIDKIKEQG